MCLDVPRCSPPWRFDPQRFPFLRKWRFFHVACAMHCDDRVGSPSAVRALLTSLGLTASLQATACTSEVAVQTSPEASPEDTGKGPYPPQGDGSPTPAPDAGPGESPPVLDSSQPDTWFCGNCNGENAYRDATASLTDADAASDVAPMDAGGADGSD
jgi:hypothetical protein